MKIQKCCILYIFSIAALSINAAEATSAGPSRPSITERGYKFFKRVASPSQGDTNPEKAEIERLRTQLNEKNAQIERLRRELATTREELRKEKESTYALQEIARLLNVRFYGNTSILALKRNIIEKLQNNHYLPSNRLSQEQLNTINDLLADEPGILQTIKKYHMFFREAEGKKIIIIPEN